MRRESGRPLTFLTTYRRTAATVFTRVVIGAEKKAAITVGIISIFVVW
jgi:hypothetical protein